METNLLRMKRFYFLLFDSNMSPDIEINSSPKAKNSVIKFDKTKRVKSRLDPLTQFYEQAEKIKNQIIEIVHAPAQHLAIRRMQEIFQEKEDRMYHWAKDRRVPADNNLAERDLRPTVIARKVSFGSQSDTGAQTRGVLMTTLHTLKKQTKIDVASAFKTILDQLAKDPNLDPDSLLFPNDTS